MSVEELIDLRGEVVSIMVNLSPECWEIAFLKDALIALDEKLSERADEVRALENCLKLEA